MIRALMDPGAYDHPVEVVQLLETHISWILLTGSRAYKVKKPVNLGFVNFSTPQLRRHFCEEEVRLNRRLAPDLYLGLCPIHGPPELASLRNHGPVIDTAVVMAEFPQSDLLALVFQREGVTSEQLDGLVARLASFHTSAPLAPPETAWGDPASVRLPALANLEVLSKLKATGDLGEALWHWSRSEADRLSPLFLERKHNGHVRECHGDLHLGNMVLFRGRIEIFDRLEFNPALRWIDVISDMAFLVMDMRLRGRLLEAVRVLNGWLATCGDYPGMGLWRWYVVYRALVRAKVAALRLSQASLAASEEAGLLFQLEGYLHAAHAATRPTETCLVITHGISGSGKSHLVRRLCAHLGWIHLSSDQERKRLFGRWGQSFEPSLTGDPYTPDIMALIYREKLPRSAEALLSAGFTPVVDATFLKRWQRKEMADLAVRRDVSLVILDCRISREEAIGRIASRISKGGDPSDADETVIDRQLLGMEPLEGPEVARTVVVQAGSVEADAIESIAAAISELGGIP